VPQQDRWFIVGPDAKSTIRGSKFVAQECVLRSVVLTALERMTYTMFHSYSKGRHRHSASATPRIGPRAVELMQNLRSFQ
jgi:hypothetical protein